MNNTQLLLAIGVPSLTVLVGILLNNRLLFEFKADLNRRLDGIDKRFESIDKRFDKIEARLDRMEDDMREFFKIVTRLESRVEVLERRGDLR